MIKFLCFYLVIGSQLSFAYDCSKIKPFKVIGKQRVTILVTKIFWINNKEEFKDVCEGKLEFESFDVQGREEEAFNCLKAKPLTCKTSLNDSPASVDVVPASWIRKWKPKSVREYRFHAYISKESDSNYNQDLFSRQLSENWNDQNLTLEAALKTGSKNQMESFLVRVSFQ